MTPDTAARADATGATLLGAVAILFWSSTIALSRGLAEQIGVFTSATATLLLGGAVGLIYLWLRGQGPALWRLPRAYLFGCGALVVLYYLALYVAVGFAVTRQQVIEVGLINYLWPGLTLALSIPVHGKRARAGLLPGVLIAFAGVALVLWPAEGAATESLTAKLSAGWPLYLAALAAACSWALYSNLSGRWLPGNAVSALPLFLLVAGLCTLGLRALVPETSQWTPGAWGVLAYMALAPTLLASLFWEIGMRRGRLVLLASASYLTPLLSTLISAAYLRVGLDATVWLACALIIGGALLCNLSVVENKSTG